MAEAMTAHRTPFINHRIRMKRWNITRKHVAKRDKNVAIPLSPGPKLIVLMRMITNNIVPQPMEVEEAMVEEMAVSELIGIILVVPPHHRNKAKTKTETTKVHTEWKIDLRVNGVGGSNINLGRGS
jgi:hypothetical protein